MHCWARYLLYAIVSVLAIGQMGVACGHKAPLYLPDPSEQPAANPQPDADGDTPEATSDIPSVGPQPGSDIPTPTGG